MARAGCHSATQHWVFWRPQGCSCNPVLQTGPLGRTVRVQRVTSSPARVQWWSISLERCLPPENHHGTGCPHGCPSAHALAYTTDWITSLLLPKFNVSAQRQNKIWWGFLKISSLLISCIPTGIHCVASTPLITTKHFHLFWHQREIGRKGIFGWEWKAGWRNISFYLRVSPDWLSTTPLWNCPPYSVFISSFTGAVTLICTLHVFNLFIVHSFRLQKQEKKSKYLRLFTAFSITYTASLLTFCSMASLHSCLAHSPIFLLTTWSLCSCPCWMPALFCSIK